MKGNKGLTLIFITLLIDVIGIGIIIPIMPKLLSTLGNFTNSEASAYGGYLIFAYAGMQFLFSAFMGALSDRFGRKPVLVVALIGLGIDYVFNALAPTVGLLFVGRLIAGMCGASFSTAMAYIADSSTPEKRAQNFGLMGIAFGVGFILGPVIGGLAGSVSARFPFWIAAALSLVNAIVCIAFLPESLLPENRRAFNWKRANPIGTLLELKKFKVALELMIPLFLINLASHAVQSNWSFYTKEKFAWSEAQIGISLGIVGVMVALIQGGVIRVVVPKWGERKAIMRGVFFYTVGMLLFALASQGWMIYAFTPIYTLGGIAGPTLQGLMSNQVPNDQQGELSGGMTSIIAITSILGPLMMNNLFSIFTGPNKPIYLPEAPMLAAVLLLVVALFFIYRALNRLGVVSVKK